MKGNFKESLKLVLAHEGGYVNHPKDPGGATNFGVTQAVYNSWRNRNGKPTRSVKDIAKTTEVPAIYKEGYWDKVRGDQLPDGVDYAVFDYAVNSGPGRAIKDLQRVIGAGVDGVIGNETLTKVFRMPAEDLITALCTRRLNFMKALKTWSTFGKGWSRRVMGAKDGYQENDYGVIDYAINIHRKAQAPHMSEKLPEPAAIGTIPEEQPAKAAETDLAVTKTKVGGSASLAGAGAIAATAMQAREIIEPYSTRGDWVGQMATLLFMLLVLAGIGFVIWEHRKKILERAGA